jgi:hypothetical protein
MAAVGGAEGLGGVGEQGDVMIGEEGDDTAVLGALTVDVDGDAGPVPTRFESLGEEIGIHVPAPRLAVDQDRPCPHVSDGVGGGGEGETRDEDPVLSPHPAQEQGRMQRRRPTGECHPMGAVGHGSQLDFEGIDLGAEGCDPPTLEGRLIAAWSLIPLSGGDR